MLHFDEETARQVERVYLTPDVVEQRRLTRDVLAVQPGERVLDIGSGPGLLAAELAGEGGRVLGVDPSESMLAMARRREIPQAEFEAGDALSLPVEDSSFDVAVSTQVLEYVEDVPGALREARRALRPGGRLLVLDTDWDSIVWHTTALDRMRRVLAVWDGHLADPYLPRRLPGLLREAGFTLTQTAVLPILNHPYDPNTYSAGLIPVIAAFVGDAEAAAWADELTGQGEDYFFSLNRYLFVARA
jgi:ubiquinone/menaquinone biosynthesis C-methylase UbiE